MPSECKLRDEFPKVRTRHGRQTSSAHCPKRLPSQQQTSSKRKLVPQFAFRRHKVLMVGQPQCAPTKCCGHKHGYFLYCSYSWQKDRVRVQTAQYGANPEPGRTCMAPTLRRRYEARTLYPTSLAMLRKARPCLAAADPGRGTSTPQARTDGHLNRLFD